MRKKFLKNITFFISSLVLVVAILFSFVQIKGNQGSNTASAAVTKYEQTDGLVSGLEANEGSLSTAFDLSAYYPLMVENQLSSELCWAFSSSKVLETALMVQRGEYYNFSELGIAYLGYLNGNNFISDEAGDFNEFVNIMQQQGLVFENDFSNEAINDLTGIAGNSDVERYRDKVVSQKTREFSNTMLPVYLTDSAAYKSLYRQNNFDANSDFIKLIKSYIMTYGGLFGGLKQGTVSNQNLGIATYSEEINTYGDPSAGSYFPKGSTQGLGHGKRISQAVLYSL